VFYSDKVGVSLFLCIKFLVVLWIWCHAPRLAGLIFYCLPRRCLAFPVTFIVGVYPHTHTMALLSYLEQSPVTSLDSVSRVAPAFSSLPL